MRKEKMTNLELYKKDIKYYLSKEYTLQEALDQVFDDLSDLKRIYPKDLSDLGTMIKQDIRLLDWLADGVGNQKHNNYQKNLENIKKHLKKTKATLDEVFADVYNEATWDRGNDFEIFEWMLEEVK